MEESSCFRLLSMPATQAMMSVKYIWKGIKTLWRRKIEVPVLDATAIGVSVFRGDMGTASFHHVSFRNRRASGRMDA